MAKRSELKNEEVRMWQDDEEEDDEEEEEEEEEWD